MKVILLEPLENLGDVGTVVDIKPGYARNYLIPSGYVAIATSSNLRALEARIRAQAKRSAERKAEAERLRELVETLTLEVRVRAGESKIYGSVTRGDLAEAMEAQHQIHLDSRRLELVRPIKELGSYQVVYKPHPEVPITLKLVVSAQKPA